MAVWNSKRLIRTNWRRGWGIQEGVEARRTRMMTRIPATKNGLKLTQFRSVRQDSQRLFLVVSLSSVAIGTPRNLL